MNCCSLLKIATLVDVTIADKEPVHLNCELLLSTEDNIQLWDLVEGKHFNTYLGQTAES